MSKSVVIVGGGVIGASIAYHLTGRDADVDVTLIERSHAGSGSTGKAAGFIREGQFSNPIDVQMRMGLLDFYADLLKDDAFVQCGYLVLGEEEDVDTYRQIPETAGSHGVEGVETLEIDDVTDLIPDLTVSDVAIATFEAGGGYVDTYELNRGLLRVAQQQGTRVVNGASVTDITTDRGAVSGVKTSAGDFAADVVVNAAGPWAGEIAAMVDLEIPVKTTSLPLAIVDSVSFPYEIPIVMDIPNGFYMRPTNEPNRMVVGYLPDGVYDYESLDITDPDAVPTAAGLDWISNVTKCAIHRFPPLEAASIGQTWTGPLTITPDAHPILGPVPNPEGFILANGMSGEGLQLAPNVGDLIADLITGETPNVDVSSLRYDRFENGESVGELHL